MDTRTQAQVLAELHFLDQTEVEAISSALPRIEDRELAAELEHFRDDHARHMRELDALFGECGEAIHPTVPEAMRSAAERRLGAVRDADGDDALLRELLTAEKADAGAYEAADAARLPSDEGPVIHGHLGDERRHVETLSRRLSG